MNRFDQLAGPLRRRAPEILQVNLGKLCNQTCAHCHVNAGPGRTELMSRDTLERVLAWLERTPIGTVDITGGAPELNPQFRHLVERARAQGRQAIDRCNLTIFFEPSQEDLPGFLAAHQVEVTASLPCYSEANVDAQRGQGVFEKSIRALQWLNRLGYGSDPALRLNLVYNPVGAKLPGPQAELQADYQAELDQKFGIRFNRLYTITNMPIARFAAWLARTGQLERYQQLLVENFNPAALEGLMCRHTLSIGWRGEVYDCDFNQMLDLQWYRNGTQPYQRLFLWDIDPATLDQRPIQTGNHCFGCTAGAGSGCSGAILKP